MEPQTLIQIINSDMALELPQALSLAELRLRLQAAINLLIEKNFQQLVHILYRVDVNERKLKYLLQENVGEEAAVIIADLIIERQLEKMASRAAWRPQAGNDAPAADEEMW